MGRQVSVFIESAPVRMMSLLVGEESTTSQPSSVRNAFQNG